MGWPLFTLWSNITIIYQHYQDAGLYTVVKYKVYTVYKVQETPEKKTRDTQRMRSWRLILGECWHLHVISKGHQRSFVFGHILLSYIWIWHNKLAFFIILHVFVRWTDISDRCKYWFQCWCLFLPDMISYFTKHNLWLICCSAWILILFDVNFLHSCCIIFNVWQIMLYGCLSTDVFYANIVQ